MVLGHGASFSSNTLPSISSVMCGGVLKKCSILDGGCILFLLAMVGLRKRLFLLPIKSLKEGVLSDSVCGFNTSLRNACLENPSCSFDPMRDTLFRFCTQRSTASPSPIWTIAQPSFVFRNLTRSTLPYRQNMLNSLSALDLSGSSP